MFKRPLLMLLAGLVACAPTPEPSLSSTTSAVATYPTNSKFPPDYTDSTTGLPYGGGDVLTYFSRVYIIFYGTNWSSSDANILQVFTDSLSGTPLWSVLNTFYENGSLVPSTFEPTLSVFDNASVYGPALDDNSLESVIQWNIANNGLPLDDRGLYIVAGSKEVSIAAPWGGLCNNYCAYHRKGWDLDSGRYTKIAFVGDPRQCHNGTYSGTAVTRCDFPGGLSAISPNGSPAADEMVNILWHELAETVTDPSPPGGWGFGSPVTETGDLCGGFTSSSQVGYAQVDGPYDANGGTGNANVHLVGDGFSRDYLVQPMWQNINRGGCVMRVVPQRASAKVFTLNTPTGDIDGNFVSDLIWHNPATGWIHVSELSRGATSASLTPVVQLPVEDRMFGIGDLDFNGTADLLVEDSINGMVLGLLNIGGTFSTDVLGTLPPDQEIVAVGDFDGNGFVDFLTQSNADSSTRVWLNSTNRTVVTGAEPFTSVQPGTTSQFETLGTGDFDGDGRADVLWRNVSDGSFSVWRMTGTDASAHPIAPPLNQVMGIVDIDHDGVADLVGTATTSSGTFIAWARMVNGFPGSTAQLIQAVPAARWRYSGGGYFGSDSSGTATSGLLWRNRITGATRRWLLSSTGAVLSSVDMITPSLDQDLVSY